MNFEIYLCTKQGKFGLKSVVYQINSIIALARVSWYTLYSFFAKNLLQLQNESELIISCQKSSTGEFRCKCAQQTEVKCCKKTIDCPFFWRVLQIIDCFENDLHV